MPGQPNKANAKGLNYHGGGWRFRVSVNGKQHWVNVPREIQGVREAHQFKNRYLATPERKRVAPSRVKFGAVARDAMLALDRKRSPGTMRGHRQRLATHLSSLEHLPIQGIDKYVLIERVIEPMKERGLAGNTIHHALVTASVVFEYGIDCRPPLVEENPVRRIKGGDDKPSRKTKKQRVILTLAQLGTFLEYCERPRKQHTRKVRLGEIRALAALLALAGLRLSEGLRLQWEWVDFEGRKIWPNGTKNEASAEGYVELSSTLAKILRAHQLATGRRSGLVCATAAGEPLDKSNVRHTFDYVIAQIQADDPTFPRFTPHHLRHTFVTFLMHATKDIGLVARNARHANADVTLAVYTHEWKDAQNETRAADAIDAVFGALG